jgi:hypothetical protein
MAPFTFVQQVAWRIFGVSPQFREVLGGKCVVVAMGTFRTLSAMTKIIERARTGMDYKHISILAFIKHTNCTDVC